VTQVFGWLIVTLTVVLAVLGIVATTCRSRWLTYAVFLVASLIVVSQTWQAMTSYAEEQFVRRRVTEAIGFLVQEADSAAQLEYRMRGDHRPDTKEKLAEYVAEIERWRKRTGDALKERFPKTGADRVFLAAVGDVGLGPSVPALSRAIYYEYTRLRHCQTALFAVLASVDAFVRREQLVEPSRDPAGHGERSAAPWWPSSDVLLAVFTLLLVVVGVLQWCTLNATHKSNNVVERAYVALSHLPPGLEFPDADPPAARVSARVRNHGNTPADVTAISLRLVARTTPLPDTPASLYAAPEKITAFLTARDKFFVRRSWPLAANDFEKIKAGTARLYLVGYVDYQDRFGRRHRHGYARVFDGTSPGNNLVFVTNTGYNYDVTL